MVCLSRPYPFFLKAVFRKFYLVHSWVPCPKYACVNAAYQDFINKFIKAFDSVAPIKKKEKWRPIPIFGFTQKYTKKRQTTTKVEKVGPTYGQRSF